LIFQKVLDERKPSLDRSLHSFAKMNFQAAFLFSLLLFFTVGIESTISQSMELPAEPTFLGHSTITVTTTPASPKITYTKTTTVTTYGLPSHFTYQVSAFFSTDQFRSLPPPGHLNP
jgi:hypothetical protein